VKRSFLVAPEALYYIKSPSFDKSREFVEMPGQSIRILGRNVSVKKAHA